MLLFLYLRRFLYAIEPTYMNRILCRVGQGSDDGGFGTRRLRQFESGLKSVCFWHSIIYIQENPELDVLRIINQCIIIFYLY